MRVLLYGINYSPELTGCGKYTGEMAEWLAARDAHVTVVTAPPYYPAWRVDAPHAWHRYRAEKQGRIEIVRCPLFVPKRPSGLKRVLHLLSFACTSLPVLLWLALRRRPDVIVAIEPPFLGAPAAWLAARLTGAAAWLHVQDFEIDAAFELGLLRSERLRQIVLRAERALMRRFDRVTTISERMRSRLRAKGVPSERAQLFPNWVDLQHIRPLPKRSRSAYFRADDIVVLYSGNMGKKQGLEMLLEAARLVAAAGESRIRFLICGDGVERAELATAAQGLTNVSFAPLVPLERLNDLLNLADIHVLPQRADAEDLAFPSKLTNMLASGRPVVSTARAGTQIASVLDGCGVVVPPGDAAALARALCELAGDALRRQILGAEARRVAERLWDKDTVLANAFGPYLEPAPLAAAAAHVSPVRARPRRAVAGAVQPLLLRYLRPRLRQTLSNRRQHAAEQHWPLPAPTTALPLEGARIFDLLVGDVALRSVALPRFYERELWERIVALARGGGTLVDLAANKGYFTLLWCAAHPTAAAFALEGAPRNLESLWRNVAGNALAKRITVVPRAALDHDDATDFSGPPGMDTEPPKTNLAILKIDVQGALVLRGNEGVLRDRQVSAAALEHDIGRWPEPALEPSAVRELL